MQISLFPPPPALFVEMNDLLTFNTFYERSNKIQFIFKQITWSGIMVKKCCAF